jgi:transcriptional regulator with XRE-family HTH domain
MDNKLRELRNRRGLSAENIAEALNITTGYYYKLERGKKERRGGKVRR